MSVRVGGVTTKTPRDHLRQTIAKTRTKSCESMISNLHKNCESVISMNGNNNCRYTTNTLLFEQISIQIRENISHTFI